MRTILNGVKGFFKAFFSVGVFGLAVWILSCLIGCTFECVDCDEHGDVVVDCGDEVEPEPEPPADGGASELEPEPEPTESTIWCRIDNDHDGHGAGAYELYGTECPRHFVEMQPNCADHEFCDGIDNNCNEEVDEGCEEEEFECEADTDCSEFDTECLVFRCRAGGCFAFERDDDGDGHSLCGGLPEGEYYDCDDTNPAMHPGAEELCDDLDNNCDGFVDEWCGDGRS